MKFLVSFVLLASLLLAHGLDASGFGRLNFGSKGHGGRGKRGEKMEKIAALIAACPVETAQCGVVAPVQGTRPDKDAIKAAMQCLKAIDLTTVSTECAAALNFGGKGKRGEKMEKIAALIAACPLEAAACNVVAPVPGTRPDKDAMKATMQCLKAIDLTTVSTECAAALNFGGKGKRGEKMEKIAALIAACPRETAACNLHAAPVQGTRPDKDAIKAAMQCLKAIDLTTVSTECAAALNFGGKGKRGEKMEKIAALIAACPLEAAACNVVAPVPGTRPDKDAMKATMQCLKAIDLTTVSTECADALSSVGRGRRPGNTGDTKAAATSVSNSLKFRLARARRGRGRL